MSEHDTLRHFSLREMRDALLDATRVVLTTHTNPDGDALGSEIALLRFLRDRGVACRIINCDPVPENLVLLDTAGDFETWDPGRHAEALAEADCIVALDFNQPSRVREMESALRASPARRLVIDHHQQPRPFADAYLTVTEASSTAEIVHDLIEDAGGEVTGEIALGLYVGIMTDTGSFRFDRTTPRVHRITAGLLEAGVDPTAVYRFIYDEYPVGRTQLLGRVLAGIGLCCEGRATIFHVTRQMLAETHTTLDDVENMVNYGLSIRGVELTALITEIEEGCKISFRSSGRVRVDQIAGLFGGGGHQLAAGAHIDGGEVEALRGRIEKEFCSALRDG
jgi:phosphoesterase RecJ-like protein